MLVQRRSEAKCSDDEADDSEEAQKQMLGCFEPATAKENGKAAAKSFAARVAKKRNLSGPIGQAPPTPIGQAEKKPRLAPQVKTRPCQQMAPKPTSVADKRQTAPATPRPKTAYAGRTGQEAQPKEKKQEEKKIRGTVAQAGSTQEKYDRQVQKRLATSQPVQPQGSTRPATD